MAGCRRPSYEIFEGDVLAWSRLEDIMYGALIGQVLVSSAWQVHYLITLLTVAGKGLGAAM
jgi:hypothetical protein